MTPSRLRPLACLLAGLVASSVTFIGVATPAHAASGLDAAIGSFGITDYTLTTIDGSGDITKELQYAVGAAGTSATAHVVHLPTGDYQVRTSIRVAAYVYVVADAKATVELSAPAAQLLQFPSLPAAGATGGSWDAGQQGTANVFTVTGSSVSFSHLSITNAGKHGIGAYQKSRVTVRDVEITDSARDGIHAEQSTLAATTLSSTYNRNNGVQLSVQSSGTISDSRISFNGQAVTGTTDGKTGHGLGVANSWATVLNSDLSDNKVCGISTTEPSTVTVRNATVNRNGRHGLGTTAGGKVSFTDTTFIGNGYNGVLVTGSGTAVTLLRVTIANSAAYGVSLPNRASVVLTNTSVSGSGKSNVAADLAGSVTLASGNTITRAGAHGIAIAGKAKLTISGSSNVVSYNAANGLMLSNRSTSGKITKRVSFVGNKQIGVLVREKATLRSVSCTFSANPKSTVVRSGGKSKKL
jgi:hypothetical protein